MCERNNEHPNIYLTLYFYFRLNLQDRRSVFEGMIKEVQGDFDEGDPAICEALKLLGLKEDD